MGKQVDAGFFFKKLTRKSVLYRTDTSEWMNS